MSEGSQQPPNGIPESHHAETYHVPDAFLKYVRGNSHPIMVANIQQEAPRKASYRLARRVQRHVQGVDHTTRQVLGKDGP